MACGTLLLPRNTLFVMPYTVFSHAHLVVGLVATDAIAILFLVRDLFPAMDPVVQILFHLLVAGQTVLWIKKCRPALSNQFRIGM
jgi:hypothetical protein